jgi:hypothetical protein
MGPSEALSWVLKRYEKSGREGEATENVAVRAARPSFSPAAAARAREADHCGERAGAARNQAVEDEHLNQLYHRDGTK